MPPIAETVATPEPEITEEPMIKHPDPTDPVSLVNDQNGGDAQFSCQRPKTAGTEHFFIGSRAGGCLVVLHQRSSLFLSEIRIPIEQSLF